jgi:hypothetical protein
MPVSEAKAPPILRHKRYEAASAFTPENLLRQARATHDTVFVAVVTENVQLGVIAGPALVAAGAFSGAQIAYDARSEPHLPF